MLWLALLGSGVNLVWNLGVVDPGETNFHSGRKNSIFQACIYFLVVDTKNVIYPATFLIHDHFLAICTYILYMKHKITLSFGERVFVNYFTTTHDPAPCDALPRPPVVRSMEKRLSNRNSFTNTDESEIINFWHFDFDILFSFITFVINENKLSKSKCQKLIIKCY